MRKTIAFATLGVCTALSVALIAYIVYATCGVYLEPEAPPIAMWLCAIVTTEVAVLFGFLLYVLYDSSCSGYVREWRNNSDSALATNGTSARRPPADPPRRVNVDVACIKATSGMTGNCERLQRAIAELAAGADRPDFARFGHRAANLLDEWRVVHGEVGDALKIAGTFLPGLPGAHETLSQTFGVINETVTGPGNFRWVESRMTRREELVMLAPLLSAMATVSREAVATAREIPAASQVARHQGMIEQGVEDLLCTVLTCLLPMSQEFCEHMDAGRYRDACRVHEHMRYKAYAVVKACGKTKFVDERVTAAAKEADAILDQVTALCMRNGHWSLEPAVDDLAQVTAAVALNVRLQELVTAAVKAVICYREGMQSQLCIAA